METAKYGRNPVRVQQPPQLVSASCPQLKACAEWPHAAMAKND